MVNISASSLTLGLPMFFKFSLNAAFSEQICERNDMHVCHQETCSYIFVIQNKIQRIIPNKTV